VPFGDLTAELRGVVPKFPISYAPTIVNRAWRDIRQRHLWSFNLVEFAWISPLPVTTGLCTFTQGSATITFDATAVAAINAFQIANPYVLVTQMQVRSGNVAGLSGIYNIIAYNPGTGVATLDRIYADASGTAVSYTLFQAYYTPPVKDWLTFLSVRNMQMFLDLNLSKTKSWVDARDPQRSWYQFPTHVIPFGRDNRGSGTATPSSTLGYPLYELWGIAVTPFTYDCYGLRKGVDLVNPTDALPDPVGEDTVMALAEFYAYKWAEANKGLESRMVGSDYRFLMATALDEYKRLLARDRREDRETLDNYFQAKEPDIASHAFGYYNTVGMVAGPYTQL
jgi:hypothetical protein